MQPPTESRHTLAMQLHPLATLTMRPMSGETPRKMPQTNHKTTLPTLSTPSFLRA